VASTGQLSRHVITEVTTAQVGYEYLRPIGRNSFRGHLSREGSSTVYVIGTNRGGTGWGLPVHVSGDPRQLIGRNLAGVFDPAVGVTDPAVLVLDHALHDLAGRILDVPVHAMLGGGGGASGGSLPPRCYSGGIYFDDLDPDDHPTGLAAIAANLDQDHEFGFRDFKLKLGRGYRWMGSADGLRRDIEVTRFARERFPRAQILVDPNDAYSPRTVADYLDAVADCDLYWVEEPFPERIEDMRFLREYVDQLRRPPLIADGEYEPDERHVLRLAGERLLDVALMDVCGYGVTAWRRVMPALAATGADASPHAWGLPLKTVYAAHIAAGLGNVQTIEGVPALTLGVDSQGYVLRDGRIQLSDRAGYGIDLI
jgi:D-galactarolactone cycloisomerase